MLRSYKTLSELKSSIKIKQGPVTSIFCVWLLGLLDSSFIISLALWFEFYC